MSVPAHAVPARAGWKSGPASWGGPIAVIGIDARFPGADDLETHWKNLDGCRDLIRDVPRERWDWKELFGDPAVENRTRVNQGGFIDEVDRFDARFWGISPREAKLMDPQQRLVLESAWHCIEDAGLRVGDLAGSETGVFVAVSKSDYEELLYRAGVPIEAGTSTGVASSVIPNRVSYLLKLHGPSFPIDTACSGSLIALHAAVQALHSGDCSLALAAGVNVILTPTLTLSFDRAGMLSPDCRSRAFDESANGYARGEGVVTVLLKRLEDAERDGDPIYGVVRGSAINHGGHTNSLTAPNALAQKELIKKAVRRAGVDPRTITYIEAHGTGTRLGDPIEFNGIKDAFEELSAEIPGEVDAAPACGVGSVKTNIGHLEAAAGLAGVVKVLLAMRHGRIPGNPHLRQVNPYCKAEGTRFFFVTGSQPWERTVGRDGMPRPRRAGVSSFGFGGAYGHVVLEEYAPAAPRAGAAPVLPVFPLSARDEPSLRAYAEKVLRFAEARAGSDGWTPARVVDFVADRITGWTGVDARAGGVGADASAADLGLDVDGYVRLAHDLRMEFGLSVPRVLFGAQSFLPALREWLEGQDRPASGDAEPDFEDFLYTFQVGRDVFAERLAVACDGWEGLARGLSRFLAGVADPRVLASRGAAPDAAPEMDELSRLAVEFAARWVRGDNADFAALYRGARRRRVSGPGYPFARTRYWFEAPVPVAQPPVPGPRAAEEVPGVPVASEPAPPAAPRPRPVLTSADAAAVSLEVVDGGVAVVRLAGPDEGNMFSDELMRGMRGRFAEIEEDGRVHAVVVASDRRVFSMGGTPEWLVGIARGERAFTDEPFLYEGFLRCTVPVVSAIEGHAFGGGLLLGLYADVPVLAEDGLYSANFMKHGFTPGMGATLLLREKLGRSLGTEMMLTGRSYRGAELRERGAGVRVVPRGEVFPQALQLAREMAELPAAASRALKRELAGDLLERLARQVEREARMHREVVAVPVVARELEARFSAAENGAAVHEARAEPAASGPHRIRLAPASVLAPAQRAEPLRIILASPLELAPAGAPPAAAASARPAAEVERAVREVLAAVLHLDSEDVEGDAVLRELGLDSITGIEVAKALETRLGAVLTSDAVFRAETVSGLAALATPAAPGPAPAAAVPEVCRPGAASAAPPAPDAGRLRGVCEAVARVLHLDPADFDADTPLREIGLDSISAIEIARALEARFGAALRADQLARMDSCRALDASLPPVAGAAPVPDPVGLDLDALLAGVATGTVSVEAALDRLN